MYMLYTHVSETLHIPKYCSVKDTRISIGRSSTCACSLLLYLFGQSCFHGCYNLMSLRFLGSPVEGAAAAVCC